MNANLDLEFIRPNTLETALRFSLVLLIFFSVADGRVFASDEITASEDVTAVSSKIYNNYSRTQLADGSYRPESYAFGNGGFVVTPLGALHDATIVTFMRDDSIDNMTFQEVANTVKGPLSSQKYFLSHDPNSTSLLIMVFWGLTVGGINTAGPDRDKIDRINAGLLGFDSERVFSETDGLATRANLMKEVHADILSEIEPNRYWVALRAFDFRTAWKEKRLKLLWESRFSLSQHRHDFARDLHEMTSIAAKYFGQDTHGLLNKPPPEGHVNIGPIKTLGDIPKKDPN
jgi:hypothetical protein